MEQPSRLELVDSLRGYALFGLFLVHSVELFELYWAHPTPSAVHDWVFGLFAGKAFALFALCFGLSFFIIMDRAAQRGVDFSARFAWRLAILFVFGILHGLVYRGDILQVLAPMGLLLLLFHRIRSRSALLLIAALCFAEIPLLIHAWCALAGAAWARQLPHFFTDPSLTILANGSLSEAFRANLVDGALAKWWFYIETGRLTEIAGLFVIGLLLGRSGFFAAPDRFVRQRRVVLAIAIASWVALYFLGPICIESAGRVGDSGGAMRRNVEWAFESWSALAAMTIQVVLFIELYQTAAQPILKLLAPVGRMTLSLYIGQSLVFVPLYYGFGLGMHAWISQAEALAMGVIAFAVQIPLARLWFRYFLYGPLEWLWRALTNTTLAIPFVRRA
ncbi:DUF418 domain-containing protein [Sphingomonas oligophenolica]|uniref:DUF418 domain-containing protein n=1 Tax=Sphingomonas oligophenolica TaxID=301154 RepID=A0ABU9Y106_9SPHN